MRRLEKISLTELENPEQRTIKVLSSLSYRTGELSRYLQAVAQGVSELIGIDWSVVTFCQDGCERILASTIDLGEAADHVYTLHGRLTGTVIETGAPLVVEDATTCRDYGAAPEGYRAYLGVPLRTPAGKVVGTICSFQHQPRHFTVKEVQLAEVFAERAATAIDNHQLYQQQQAEIAERQRAEEALKESEEWLRSIFDGSRDAIFIVGADTQFVDINEAAAALTGYSRQELKQMKVTDLYSVEDLGAGKAVFSRILAGETFIGEAKICRKDGTKVYTEFSNHRILVRDIEYTHIVARDITGRKQAQQEMLKATTALAEVGELAATIVHELRNPLTTVLMGLNTFKRLDLPESAKERLALSLEEAERIRNLLKEILLYAKPQALQRTKLELNEFITGILESIRTMPSALSRRIEFVPALHAVTISADRDKLRQVFINLIDNACEAIAEGDTVTWSVEPDVATDRVWVRIHNGGDPVPPEVLPKLTKPFFTTKSAGTGLGLAIVTRIVDAHGGEMAITSSAAQGTIVSLRLVLVK